MKLQPDLSLWTGRLPSQPYCDPVVLACGALIQQRDAVDDLYFLSRTGAWPYPSISHTV